MNIINIGLFGGTFDPIHMGHIIPIKKAAKQLALNKVNIIPTNIPPHKEQPQSNSFHRSEMVKIVCQNEPLFNFDDRELKRKKSSYTVDSLREITHEFNNKNQKTNLFFFMGMDSLNTFTSWYQWQEILSLCHLVVMPRPGYTLDKKTSSILLSKIINCSDKNHNTNLSYIDANASKKKSNSIFIMHDTAMDISSTEIRTLLSNQKNGMPSNIKQNNLSNKSALDALLPVGIYEYILANQLY